MTLTVLSQRLFFCCDPPPAFFTSCQEARRIERESHPQIKKYATEGLHDPLTYQRPSHLAAPEPLCEVQTEDAVMNKFIPHDSQVLREHATLELMAQNRLQSAREPLHVQENAVTVGHRESLTSVLALSAHSKHETERRGHK